MAGVEAEINVHPLQSFNTEGTESAEKSDERFSCPMGAHALVFSLLLSVPSVPSVTSVLKVFLLCVCLEGCCQMI